MAATPAKPRAKSKVVARSQPATKKVDKAPVKRLAAPVSVKARPASVGFATLVDTIRRADLALAAQAVKAVNISLTLRNWFIGCYIAEFELRGADRARYGDRLLPELAKALSQRKVSNTGMRQLYSYLSFYRAYPNILRTASAKSLSRAVGLVVPSMPTKKLRTVSAISAGTISPPAQLLLNSLSYSHFELLVEQAEALKRSFYEVETLRGNWSVRELRRQITTQYFERTGLSSRKISIASKPAASPAAQLQDPAFVIRDPYVFEFLGLQAQDVMTENLLEAGLLNKLQSFLLELGHGFCFEARQKRLLIGTEHFFVDLVFYHRVLKCHVLIELKNDAFKHEHLGQLNSYVNYFRENEMNEGDAPPVGILLCTAKNQELVKFALAGMANKLFVSRYQVQLPGKDQITAFLHQALRELVP
jgi:predicted nuclease of restriction endonuclease-like (RecB) superfamily